MPRILNIARLRDRLLVPAATVVVLASVSCERVPLLAPSGSTITLTASTTAISVNGTAQLIAQVVEPAGTPPHSGTHVIFTTTLGSVKPSEGDTDINGRVLAIFDAGSANGTATITATSGGVGVVQPSSSSSTSGTTSPTNSVKIAVGTAAVGRVVVAANPTLIPASGGNSVISATISDINGNALAFAPVAFSTTAGIIDPPLATTDSIGVATSNLRTSTTATVTASVGAQAGSSGGGGTGGGGTGGGTTTSPTGQASGSVTVNVAAAPTLVITPPATPSAGLPATFTFAVTVPATNGSAIRDLTVNWGDGSPSQSLGAISTTAAATHVYHAQGSYVVVATLVDVLGNTVQQSAPVTVIPVPKPQIIITPSPVPGKAGTQTTLTIQVTLPNGISVTDLSINFGDGLGASLGGATSASVPHVYTAPGTYTVTVTVVDTSGQTTIGSTAVSIGT
jgi:hypothetical protein